MWHFVVTGYASDVMMTLVRKESSEDEVLISHCTLVKRGRNTHFMNIQSQGFKIKLYYMKLEKYHVLLLRGGGVSSQGKKNGDKQIE